MREDTLRYLRELTRELAEQEGIPAEVAAVIVLTAAEKVRGRLKKDAQFIRDYRWLVHKPAVEA